MLKTSKFRIVLIQTLILNKSISTRSIQNYHTLPRLFIPHTPQTTRLNTGTQVPLSGQQIHYLTTVLRLGSNRKKQSQVRIFNSINGEWLGTIHHHSKKEINIECIEQLRPPQTNKHNCWLLFAPIQQPKRLKYMIEKCTEMGVSKFIPFVSDRTQLNNIKWESLMMKWRAIAIEASEQCERLDVPIIDFDVSDNIGAPLDMKQLLNEWEEMDRILYICCERNNNNNFFHAMQNKNVSFMIGPEGGWSDAELDFICDKANDTIQLLSLGDNVLRAETAAIVSVAGWSLWRSCNDD